MKRSILRRSMDDALERRREVDDLVVARLLKVTMGEHKSPQSFGRSREVSVHGRFGCSVAVPKDAPTEVEEAMVEQMKIDTITTIHRRELSLLRMIRAEFRVLELFLQIDELVKIFKYLDLLEDLLSGKRLPTSIEIGDG